MNINATPVMTDNETATLGADDSIEIIFQLMDYRHVIGKMASILVGTQSVTSHLFVYAYELGTSEQMVDGLAKVGEKEKVSFTYEQHHRLEDV